MAACIKEMIGGCSEHASEDDTDAWLKTIDRGGLWHVNQEVYVLLELMEEYIRHYFPTAVDHTEGIPIEFLVHETSNAFVTEAIIMYSKIIAFIADILPGVYKNSYRTEFL